MNTRLLWLASLSLLAITGCGDDPTAPASTGSVELETVTTGASLDVDGYLVSLGGGPTETIGANATFTASGVAPGVQTIELSGLAPNCTLAGENPRHVAVTAGETTATRFEVSCEGVGSIEIRTLTGGASLDPDGYVVSVAGGSEQPLSLNGTMTFQFVAAGTRSVELRGISPNCTVADENPRDVTVVVDAVAPTQFEVSCGAVGSIEVTTATAGVAYDIDGYSVFVTGSAGESIGYGGTVRIDLLAIGDHAVELSDVATNCTVAGENPRSVSVGLDAVTPVLFDVTCTSPYLGKIVMLSDREGNDGLYSIVLSDEDGSNPVDLMPARRPYLNPALSPDGTRIAFEEDYGGFGSDIFVMNVDGSGLVNVTGNGFGGPEATHPAWSPEGTRILFASDRRAHDWDLYAVDPDGSFLTPVLVQPGQEWEASWSPDGTRILFTDGAGSIRVANVDWSGQTTLTNSAAYDYSPAWSPDGSRIAFTRIDGDLAAQVYLMNADGSDVTKLPGTPGTSYAPSWSPDGTRILFGSRPFVSGDVFVVNTDGSGLTNLTNSSESLEEPGAPQGWR